MNNDTMSQEEVDTLLHGDEENSPQQLGKAVPNVLNVYPLGKQESDVYHQAMPTLAVVHERFARYLRLGLSEFIRRDVTITVQPVKVEEYSEFIRNLALPTNLNLIQMKPFRGLGLVVCDPELVFLTVDNLFGSDGRYHAPVEGREFTPTEQRIIRRLLKVVFAECQKAWAAVCPVELVYLRSETNIQFANIVAPTEAVVVLPLQIELGTGGGNLYLCLPYSMIEPVRDILSSTVQVERSEPDSRWVHQLKQEMQAADMELVATLAQARLTLSELLRLQKGDVITIDVPKSVVVDIANIPVLECQYGTLQGKYALKVEHILTCPTPLSESLSEEVKPHNE